jgi:TolB protein
MGEVWVVDLTNGRLTRVYDPGEAWARAFGWSPDGRRISMDVGVPGSGQSDVWIVGADGSDPLQLTDFPGREGNPVWSPDGRRIAFMAEHGGNRDIWIMPAGGGDAVRVTFHPGVDANPRWSPDGTRLAFMSDRDGGPDIWIVDLGLQLGLGR